MRCAIYFFVMLLVVPPITFSLTGDTIFDTKATFESVGASITVDAKPPLLVLSSPTNTTYSTTTIQIKFTANDEVSSVSRVWYKLDSASNVTLVGNTSIITINGTHTFTIYTNDSFNQLNSSRVVFTVGTSSSGSSETSDSGGSVTHIISAEKIEETKKAIESGAIPGYQYPEEYRPYMEGSATFGEGTITWSDGSIMNVPEEWKDIFAKEFQGENIQWENGNIINIPEEWKGQIGINVPSDWIDGVAYNIPPDFVKDFANNFLIAMSCQQPPCSVMSREILHKNFIKFINNKIGVGNIKEHFEGIKNGDIEIKGVVQLLCSGSVGESELSFDASGVSCSNVGAKVVHDNGKVEETNIESCNERSDGTIHASASFSGCSYLVVLKLNNIKKKNIADKSTAKDEIENEEVRQDQSSKQPLQLYKKGGFLKDPVIFYGSLVLVLFVVLAKTFISMYKSKKEVKK